MDLDSVNKKNVKADELFKQFDIKLTAIEVIKRFYYQILGIYIPALILYLFLYSIWDGLIKITSLMNLLMSKVTKQ